MLAPRQILFTSLDDILAHASEATWDAAATCLHDISHRGTPLVLCTPGTRVQLEPMRRKLEHVHPFLTESGRGLFIPDGYFNLRLEGAERRGRNFCVPFARPAAEAATALTEMAEECGADVVGISQMSIREISRDCGLSPKEAELYRQREFGELFFFAGETKSITEQFSQLARERDWQAVPGVPFWELSSPIREHGDNAVRYLMNIYRKTLHGRQRSVGIGGKADDQYYLLATDLTVILPQRAADFDADVLARLPRAHRA